MARGAKTISDPRERVYSSPRSIEPATQGIAWVKVGKNYVFDGPGGKTTLAELFEGRSQLVVYHFMFAPDWEEGCPSCSKLETEISDWPGVSVFYKDRDGNIYHTYSAYARGIAILNTAYNYLDLVPKGRDEDDLDFSISWVRHHDKYDDA
jgi:predicted dithiol-disulfide oxidoreductase (DUF899 family)